MMSVPCFVSNRQLAPIVVGLHQVLKTDSLPSAYTSASKQTTASYRASADASLRVLDIEIQSIVNMVRALRH